MYSSEYIHDKITEREQLVLKLLIEGYTNAQIAKELNISIHTAKAYVCSLINKYNVCDRVQVAVKAVVEEFSKYLPPEQIEIITNKLGLNFIMKGNRQ